MAPHGLQSSGAQRAPPLRLLGLPPPPLAPAVAMQMAKRGPAAKLYRSATLQQAAPQKQSERPPPARCLPCVRGGQNMQV